MGSRVQLPDECKVSLTPRTDLGRPSPYREEYIEWAYRMALLGLSGKEMAAVLDVSEMTIYAWQNRHARFRKAIVEGREQADSKVAHAFYNVATGFEREVEQIVSTPDGPQIKTYRKYFPPDGGAAMNWLANGQKERWAKSPGAVNGGEPLVEITINTSDPVEALNMYQRMIGGER